MNNTSHELWLDCINALPEQTSAITSSSVLTVVSAGAGTGKTETLSRRVAWVLATDKDCTVDQILVLTFTEKAAREMQDRIKGTISEWHSEHSAEAGHLAKALEYIDDASISTIHAFAMKVIRESGLLLDIDPSSSIVPAAREDIWWKEFSDTLSEMSPERLRMYLSDEWYLRLKTLFSNEKYTDFINCYSAEELSKLSKEASEKLGSYNRTPEELWNHSDKELINDVDSLLPKIEEIWNTWMRGIFPRLIEEGLLDGGKETESRLSELRGKYAETEYTPEAGRAFASELTSYSLSSLNRISKAAKELLAEMLEMPPTEWRDGMKRVVKMAAFPCGAEKELSALVNQTAAVGWQCWDSIRKNEGVLSMNDLIRYAGQALKMSQTYQDRFRYILVDEFQDTDALQNELIMSVWNEEKNSLFLVGDLKQSIYRFRHADLSIFQKYISLARSCTDGSYKYITLDKSFRTREALLDRFNTLFTNMWSEGLIKGSDMLYEPLVGPRNVEWWERRNTEVPARVFETMLGVAEKHEVINAAGEAKEKKEPVSETRLRLYKALGGRIKEMHSDTKIWDKKSREFKSCEWRDFAVLVPNRTLYPTLERAFESVGIPYVLCTPKDYFSRGEVTDIINFVALLADMSNPTMMSGWIVSPFCKINSEDAYALIYEAAESAKRGAPIPLPDIIEQKQPEAFARIVYLRRIARFKGVSHAILEILKDPCYLTYYDSEQRKKVNANIFRLAEIAGEYEASQGHSVAGCAEYLSYAVNQAIQKEEPDISDENNDAVNVLTIHASKGLEYPIVILGGAEGGKSKTNRFNISVRYGIAVKKIPSFIAENGIESETCIGLWSEERDIAEETAEKERLWYVAATRAREKLLLCAVVNSDGGEGAVLPPENSFIGHVLNSESESKGLFSAGYVRSDREEPTACENNKTALPDQGEILSLKRVSPAKLQRLSASAYAMLRWCPSAYRTAYRQGMEMNWESVGSESGGSAEFGSFAHHILSRWNFDPAKLDLLLPEKNSARYLSALERIPFELRKIFKSEKSVSELRRLLEKYSATDEGEFLKKYLSEGGGTVMRETPFRVFDRGLVLVGATDIFWEDGSIINLRDWKTTPESSAPSKYYEEQLLFYAFCLWKYRHEKGLPDLPISIGINYLRTESSNMKSRILREDEIVKTGESIHCAAVDGLALSRSEICAKCHICPWRGACLK